MPSFQRREQNKGDRLYIGPVIKRLNPKPLNPELANPGIGPASEVLVCVCVRYNYIQVAMPRCIADQKPHCPCASRDSTAF